MSEFPALLRIRFSYTPDPIKLFSSDPLELRCKENYSIYRLSSFTIFSLQLREIFQVRSRDAVSDCLIYYCRSHSCFYCRLCVQDTPVSQSDRGKLWGEKTDKFVIILCLTWRFSYIKSPLASTGRQTFQCDLYLKDIFASLHQQLYSPLQQTFQSDLYSQNFKRIYTEENAKVVAAVCGTELILFLAALAILYQDDLKSRMNSSLSSYHPGEIHPFLHIILVQLIIFFISSCCKIACVCKCMQRIESILFP